MVDDPQSTLAVLSHTASTLPSPVKEALGSAISRLLGGVVAIPANWLEQKAQAIKDVTEGRALHNRGMAEAALARDRAVPEEVAAAAEVFRSRDVQRARNLTGVAIKTIEIAAEDESPPTSDKPREPEADWFAAYMRHAEDASSDELQQLFAKILAGEVKRPNSYSRATLRAVAELDTNIAADFLWFWERTIGEEAPTSIINGPGDDWARLRRLRDSGLVSPIDSGIYQRQFGEEPDAPHPLILGSSDHRLVIWFDKPYGIYQNVYNLTSIGVQIGTLLEAPDRRTNLIKLSQNYHSDNVTTISLISPLGSELIWVNDNR